MNKFYDLFTVEDDADFLYTFRFDQRMMDFDTLPSHLASRLVGVYDFTDFPSSFDCYADVDADTPILLTVIFDLLHDLENELDVKQRFLAVNANFNGLRSTEIIIAAPIYLSSEPYIYVIKNLTYQECLELILIEGNCRINTFRKSQDGDARIFRDCVWNLLWGLNSRHSFYDGMDREELVELGIDPDNIFEHHCKIVQQKLGSYVVASEDSWIVANGLKCAQKMAKGQIRTWDLQNPAHLYIPDFTDGDVMEVLKLVRLIKRLAKDQFKKRFEIPEPNYD